MINNKQHIVQQIVAFIVMLTFLLPTIISVTHAAEGHNHADQCAFAGETHIHESTLDCDLGDLQTVKVDFYAFAKAYTLSTPEISRAGDTHVLLHYKRETEHVQSRGPPRC